MSSEDTKIDKAPANPAAATPHSPTTVMVPVIPSRGRLISMAIRYDHGFLVDHSGEFPVSGTKPEHREGLLTTMKQLYGEAIGVGFYTPEREDHYVGLYERAMKRDNKLSINHLASIMVDAYQAENFKHDQERPTRQRNVDAMKKAIAALSDAVPKPERWAGDLMKNHPLGTEYCIEHDGFVGKVIGYYIRDDGYPGLVLQLNGSKIVHVYGEKWIEKEMKE